jgi:predicted phage terminase large subunit-like protein
MISLPPRSGKSSLCSIHFPAYFLEKNPENRVIVGTYNQTLANKLSRSIRSLMRGRVPLNPDRKAMEEWETAKGGGVRAVGVGAGIAGVGANLIVLDDIVRSRKDANSLTLRNTMYSWYTDDIYTRMEPDSRVLLIMTRWHEDDIAGRIQNNEDDWHVINLPAIAEADDPLGREEGEALNPERYPLEKLLQIKKVMGRTFQALYQGRPTEQEGEIFKASWFRKHKVDRLPQGGTEKRRYEFVRFWDKASTVSGDYTVGALFARERISNTFYIVDIVRGRWQSHERDRIMLATAVKDEAVYGQIGTVRIRHEQEPGSSGKDAAKYTNKLLSGFSVRAIKSTGNKKLRAEPYANQCEGGNVYMLEAEWNETFIDEHAVFPNGKNDDIVDASSGAFNELSKGNSFISWG